MKFNPRMAPIKAGIFPLVNKDGMPEIAEKLYLDLRQITPANTTPSKPSANATPAWTKSARRSASPIDGQTLQDQTVTVRHRDTLQQERISIDQVKAFLVQQLSL